MKITDVIDNFFIEYEGINIKEDLALLWANDAAKKFVTAEGNSELKGRLVNIIAHRGDMPKDFYKVAQVWFNTWRIVEDKKDFLKDFEQHITNKYSIKEKILKNCSSEFEEKCYLDLSKIPTTEYYKNNPSLNAIHSELKFISELGLDINTNVCTERYNKFVYALPDINKNIVFNNTISCLGIKKYIGKITFSISENKKHINTNYPDGLVLLIYYAIPMDENGNVSIQDDSDVINCIYNYILYRNSAKDYALNPSNENKSKMAIFNTEYLRYLLLGKKNVEMIDHDQFMLIYKNEMSKILGRDMDYNPFNYD